MLFEERLRIRSASAFLSEKDHRRGFIGRKLGGVEERPVCHVPGHVHCALRRGVLFDLAGAFDAAHVHERGVLERQKHGFFGETYARDLLGWGESGECEGSVALLTTTPSELGLHERKHA